MSNAGKKWIQTFQGRALYPAALAKDQVGSIEEIAHALSLKCRFTGQCPTFYSVAEHCVRGSRGLSHAFAGAFLLHELSEVYLPDIAAPLKPMTWVVVPHDHFALMEGAGVDFKDGVAIAWSTLERYHTSVILDALGLGSIEPLVYAPEVKAMDLKMLAWEKASFFPREPQPWPQIVDVEAPSTTPIGPWNADAAEREFLGTFSSLFGSR